jgi:dihydrofolate reductase
MIVAMARNGAIGLDNQLPWYLPNDLKHFKSVTMGKPIIMGRKTYESIGKPLPGRTNIVVTANSGFRAEGVEVVHSPEQAVQLGLAIARRDGCDELLVIGGAELYRALLPQASRLYLTEVQADVAGDAFFPDFHRAQWQELSREDFKAGVAGDFGHSFVVYQRPLNG